MNTRRLEQLLGDPTDAGDARLPAQSPARRGLAVSGARDLRRVSHGRPAAARNMAVIEAYWANLSPIQPDPKPDARVRQFNEAARRPENASRFDVLRAQLLQAFQKRDLRVLGITSPRAGGGTSYTTAGLLAAFARRKDARVVGLDLNLGHPCLHSYFEVTAPGPMSALIDGAVPIESHVQRATATMALGLNRDPQAPTGPSVDKAVFADFLADLTQVLAPDMIICDLPPLLQGDAALSMLGGIDAVLIVADARSTTATQIAECERILTDQAELLGVILNHTIGGR